MLPIYHVTSNIGISMRCGINHVVLSHGTPIVALADLQPMVERMTALLELVAADHDALCDYLDNAIDPCNCYRAEAQCLLEELKGLVR